MKFLIIDDEEIIRTIVKLFLRHMFGEEGHEYIECSSCDEGVATLQEVQPDLVITDYTTPGSSSGLDVINLARTYKIPALMLTGESEELKPLFLDADSQTALLPKPARKHELMEAIIQLLTPHEA